MVAQLAAPALEPLLYPAIPPADRQLTYGYRRGADRGWEVTGSGLATAAVVQRIVLSYALGYRTRAELAREYCFSERMVQGVLRGASHSWLTQPVRARLQHHGLPVQRRPSVAVHADVRAVLERLAARASDMLLHPDLYPWTERHEVSTDLWLLSGAWLEGGR